MGRDRFPDKGGVCRICNSMGDTDWHHLISQNRCKKIGKPEWVYNRGNIVELCRSCHDETTASLARKVLSKREQRAVVEPRPGTMNLAKRKSGCTRCGRDSHTNKQCYARTHANGRSLD